MEADALSRISWRQEEEICALDTVAVTLGQYLKLILALKNYKEHMVCFDPNFFIKIYLVKCAWLYKNKVNRPG